MFSCMHVFIKVPFGPLEWVLAGEQAKGQVQMNCGYVLKILNLPPPFTHITVSAPIYMYICPYMYIYIYR
jgi:hypothetical protein